MKVNVTQKNAVKVSVGSLDPGEGFVFEGKPYMAAKSELGLNYTGFALVFNLRTANFTTMPGNWQVQLSQIDVEYTI